MRLTRIAWTVSLCAAAGCGGNRFVDLPLTDDVASVVLGVFAESEEPELFLGAAEGFVYEEALSSEAEVVVTGYRHELSQFAWPAGRLPVLAGMTDGSHLPLAAQTLVLAKGESDFVVSQDDRNATVPLASPDSSACLIAGSCYADVADVLASVCSACLVDAPAPVEPPAPVAWQAWSQCPPGASVVDDPDLGIQRCELPPSADCSGPTQQGVFGASCTSFDPCPGARFAPAPANVPLLYVDLDAAPGGDGLSGGTPLNSLSGAASRAADRTVIMLAPGTYDLPARAGGLNLLGVCPERSKLRPVGTVASSLLVENVSLETDVVTTGSLRIKSSYVEGGLLVSNALSISDSVVEGAIDADAALVSVVGSTLRGDLFAHNGAELTLDTTHFGSGVEAFLTAENTDLSLNDVRFENAKLRAEGPSLLDFEDVWFTGGGTCEQAVVTSTNTTLNWRRVDVARAAASFVEVRHSTGVIEELAVHDGGNVCGAALVFASSSELSVNKVAGARLQGRGLVVNRDAEVLIQDAAFAQGNLAKHHAVSSVTVNAGGTLTLTRAQFTDQANQVFLVTGEDSQIDLSDVVASRNTDVLDDPPTQNRDARVLEARNGSTATGRRMWMSHVNMGFLATTNGTIGFDDLHLIDSVMSVRGTEGSFVTVNRLLIEGVTGVGVCVQKAATLTVTDATIEGTQNFLSEGRRPNCPNGVVSGGSALAAGVDSHLTITRFVIDGATRSAFYTFGEGLIVPRHGSVTGTPVGVLGVPETRLEEFLITVLYQDVMTAFESL